MYIEFIIIRINEITTSIYKKKRKRRNNKINKEKKCVDKFN